MDGTISEVRVFAKTHPDGTQSPRIWAVEIYDGEQVTKKEIKDPFDSEQYSECHWYLENFVQKDSFDLGRASTVEWLLEQYAKNLARQLDLSLKERNSVTIEIHEHDLDEQSSKATIHQLYWELLEDPFVWGLDGSVRLRIRRLRSAGSGNESVPPSLSLPSYNLPKVINVLHITARNMEDNPSESEDVSPVLSLSILVDINRQLRTNSYPVRLNIRTIRSGSFKELNRFLINLRGQGNSKYFHLIHFDLHGQADTTGACLFFEDTKSSRTRPQASAKVASRLQENMVTAPYLVFNACQSAVASYGDSANTAKIFSKAGCAENVLAMSSSVLETAAGIFLRAFYSDLFLRGASFVNAAHAGRCALRDDRIRHARFRRHIRLADWFVPVVYSGLDYPQQQSYDNREETSVTSHIYGVENSIKSFELPRHDTHVYGRDFDMVKIERLVLKHRKVYLYGHPWVGKSTFLQYSCMIWRETALADRIAYINLIEVTLHDDNALAEAILEQLSLPIDQNSGATDSLLTAVSDGRKALIIIDGLHTTFTPFRPQLVSSGLQETIISKIDDFLRELSNACAHGQSGSMIILCGRSAPSRPTLRSERRERAYFSTSFDSEFRAMELRELAPADSLELWQQNVQKSDLKPTGLVDRAHGEKLSLLSRLLLGMPGGVTEIIACCEEWKIPVQDLFYRLQEGECYLYKALRYVYDSDGIFREFRHLQMALDSESFCLLLLIGLFWHQGPYTTRFAKAVCSFGACSQIDKVHNVLRYAAERGYIQSKKFQNLERIIFIHPLFTIYCRVVLHELFESIFGEIKDEPNPYSFSKDFLDAVPAHVKNVIGSFSPIYKKTDYLESVEKESLIWFLQDVDYQRAFTLACHDNVCIAHRIQPNPLANLFQNTFTFFRLCLDKSLGLDPECWPSDHILQMHMHIIAAATPTEANLFLDQYTKLLDLILSGANDNVPASPKMQRVAVTIAVSIMINMRSFTPSLPKDKYQIWVERVHPIISAWERDDPDPDGNYVTVAKQMLDVAANGTGDNAAVLSMLRGYYQSLPESSTDRASQSELLADYLARAGQIELESDGTMMSYIPEQLSIVPPQELSTLLQRMQDLRIPGGEKGNEPASEPDSMIESNVEALAAIFESQLGEEYSMLFHNRFLSVLRRCGKALASGKGRDGLNLGTEGEATKSDLMEVAMNLGDRSAVINHHWTMVMDSLHTSNMITAAEHADELQKLLEGDPMYASELEMLQLVRETFEKWKKILEAGRVNGTIEATVFTDFMEQTSKLYKFAGLEKEAESSTRSVINTSNSAQSQVRMDPQTWFEMQEDFKNMRRQLDPSKDTVSQHFPILKKVGDFHEKLQAAGTSGDWSAVWAILPEMEDLYSNEPVATFLLSKRFEQLRPCLSCMRDFQQISKRWEESINTGDLKKAKELLDSLDAMSQQVQIDPSFDVLKQGIHEYQSRIQLYRWIQLYYDTSSRGAKDFERALEGYSELLDKPDDFFAEITPLEPDIVGKILEKAREERQLCLMLLGFKQVIQSAR